MSTANPYEKFLGGNDARQAIAKTPARLAELVKKLGASGAERSHAPGKWSVRQVVCHLADAEISFAFRLRQAVAETDHVIQPFDQDHWAWPYDKLKLDDALHAFTAFREWNLRFLEQTKPEQMKKKVSHPERGEMTVETIVETMAGHDENHLRQVEAVASDNGKPRAASL